ncbi:P-loop containing nucleoside triphosphate hydrolase protein [Macrolepiota fuliginosa MF-IS2]|uniref:RNA helicase n=1 Tax=Macrolepiota fuliginosa MF-IS2 TaxID=1400762 RepID=A0A9P5XC49_9AGAR|nr:P-loop containing nucleoside triphosphate hydrolase protein [Macrolepiota fuliginosa MF-IS2]
MDLKPELLRRVYEHGFKRPLATQQRAIVAIVKGRSVVVQAQSGTGKTTTMAISVLQQIDVNVDETQALILVPTRDLAQQVLKVVTALGGPMNVRCYVCVGGTSVHEDKAKLQEGVHVVVGTPGRVHDMVNRRALKTSGIKIFCMGEADEMFSRSFKSQTHEVLKGLPKDTQLVLCAPSSQNIVKLAGTFLSDPVCISVKDESILEGIKHLYVTVEGEGRKFDAICDLYVTIRQAVIFCNSRKKVDWLVEKMLSRKFAVSAMHGQIEQKQRESSMNDFRSGTARVLITTDPRGIDVQQIPLVINYDLPTECEIYVRRVTCGGRRKGIAVNLVIKKNMTILQDIEQFCSIKIAEMPPANAADPI